MRGEGAPLDKREKRKQRRDAQKTKKTNRSEGDDSAAVSSAGGPEGDEMLRMTEADAPAVVLQPTSPQKPSDLTPSAFDDGMLVLRASVRGRSHIENDTPCQDASASHLLANSSWHLLAVSDGAGSAKYSEEGSDYAVEGLLLESLGRRVADSTEFRRDELPSPAVWGTWVLATLVEIRTGLEVHAQQRGYALRDLGCTLLVALCNGQGIRFFHVGDGRAAYQNQAGQWHSLMTPHKGAEANQTVFLTSVAWTTDQFFQLDTQQIPGVAYVDAPYRAVALLTDGVETHAYECSVLDAATGQWTDPNRPFPGFFNPLVDTVRQAVSARTPKAELDAQWEQLLTGGTPGLKAEPDDKTLLLAVRDALTA